jgi:DNA polymerase III subunit gamma/tau
VLSVDAKRIDDPEIAAEGDRDRLKALVSRYSREDLLRAFDVLTKAEQDIRAAAQPRYHLEMALLRWIYLRKLTPIEDLIAGVPVGPANRLRQGSGGREAGPHVQAAAPPVQAPPPPARQSERPAQSVPSMAAAAKAATAAVKPSAPGTMAPRAPAPGTVAPGNLKDALLAEIRKSKAVFYNMVVAQAQKIEVAGDVVTFSFSANQRHLRDQFEQNRDWLVSIGQQVSGRKLTFTSALADGAAGAAESTPKAPDKKSTLKEQALADAGVQTMLEVFPAEIRDVEEM